MSGSVHVCAPRATSTRRIAMCPTCKTRRRLRADAYEWYGTTLTCTGCGDKWTDGERHERPWAPQWWVKQIAYAKAVWGRS